MEWRRGNGVSSGSEPHKLRAEGVLAALVHFVKALDINQEPKIICMKFQPQSCSAITAKEAPTI